MISSRMLFMNSQDLHMLSSGYHRCLKRSTKKFWEEHLQPTRRLGADGTMVQGYFTSQGLLLPILWKCYWYLLFERRISFLLFLSHFTNIPRQWKLTNHSNFPRLGNSEFVLTWPFFRTQHKIEFVGK